MPRGRTKRRAALLILLLARVPLARAATLEVCWSGCPYSSISGALFDAANGDTVLVHPGAYYETLDFAGKSVQVRSSSGPDSTMLSGFAVDTVVSFVSGEGPETVLEGFTVTGGTGRGPEGSTRGGGIFVEGASPTISNCRIVGNNAAEGGGLWCRSGAPLISECLISGNRASGNGGGISCGEGAAPHIRRCRIAGNTAGGGGGGIALAGPPPASGDAGVENSQVTGNAAGSGGGVWASGARGTLQSATLSGNLALTGGALSATGGAELQVRGSILRENSPSGIHVDATSSAAVSSSDMDMETPGEGNIVAPPLFVGPREASSAPDVSGDYHLQHRSPAVDRAAAAGDAGPDIDGEPRPGGAQDMGADEVTSVLVNGDFEEGPDAVPAGWSGSGLTARDRRVCSGVSRRGDCSFVFSGSARAKKLTNVDGHSGVPGDVLMLSAWSRARLALPTGGIYTLALTVRYTDGSRRTLRRSFTAGTHGWECRQVELVAAKEYQSVSAVLQYSGQGGKAWFDDVRLTRRSVFSTAPVDPAGDFLLLPDGPDPVVEYPPVDLRQTALGVRGEHFYLRFDFAAQIPTSPPVVGGEQVQGQEALVTFDTGGDTSYDILFLFITEYGVGVSAHCLYDFVPGSEDPRGHLLGDILAGGPGSSYVVARFPVATLGDYFPRDKGGALFGWSEAWSPTYHHFAGDQMIRNFWIAR